MKTVLRITMILLVGTLIAGVFFFAVNNGTTTSGSTNGQPPVLTSSGQFTNQQISPFEGRDRDGGSITQ